jgi:hypothetical protein
MKKKVSNLLIPIWYKTDVKKYKNIKVSCYPTMPSQENK